MPLKIYVSGKEMDITPTPVFTSIQLDTDKAVITVDPGFYVATLDITGK